MSTPYLDSILTRSEKINYFKSALRNGECLKHAAAKYNIGTNNARRIASSIGWTLKWRKKRSGLSGKCGKLTINDVIRLHNQEHTLQYIGKLAGVTRERIRQVLNEQNINPRIKYKERCLKLKRRHSEHRKNQLEINFLKRYLKIHRKYKTLINLYNKGVSLKTIGRISKLHNFSFCATICRLRITYGMFYPFRRNTGVKYEQITRDKHEYIKQLFIKHATSI